MPFGISLLSFLASGLYAVLVCLLVITAQKAADRHQPRWHYRSWVILSVLFAALALARLFDVEDVMRDNLRDLLRSEGAYANRRDIQRPLAAGLLGFVMVAGMVWAFRAARMIEKGRRNVAVVCANAAGLAMATLFALRLISLSPIDALLYGPIKLNWIADIGLTCAAGGAALYYLNRLRKLR